MASGFSSIQPASMNLVPGQRERMRRAAAITVVDHRADESWIDFAAHARSMGALAEKVTGIGDLELGAGSFHLGRKDVLHEPLISPEGALLFLRGAVPEEALLL